MKLSDLDQAPSGNKPLANCVRLLRHLLASGARLGDQHLDALQAVDEAETLLETELSPNVRREDLLALSTPTGRDIPLRQLLERFATEGVSPTREHLLALHLYESALLAKVDAMEAVLAEVNVRVAFIGWPAETHWNAGTAKHPWWVPDWRRQIALIQAARHNVAFKEPEPWETLPWHRIPEEHRPAHAGQGAQRLHALHLAWLRYRERIDEAGDPTGEHLGPLLALKDAIQAAFERRAPVQP